MLVAAMTALMLSPCQESAGPLSPYDRKAPAFHVLAVDMFAFMAGPALDATYEL